MLHAVFRVLRTISPRWDELITRPACQTAPWARHDCLLPEPFGCAAIASEIPSWRSHFPSSRTHHAYPANPTLDYTVTSPLISTSSHVPNECVRQTSTHGPIVMSSQAFFPQRERSACHRYRRGRRRWPALTAARQSGKQKESPALGRGAHKAAAGYFPLVRRP